MPRPGKVTSQTWIFLFRPRMQNFLKLRLAALSIMSLAVLLASLTLAPPQTMEQLTRSPRRMGEQIKGSSLVLS